MELRRRVEGMGNWMGQKKQTESLSKYLERKAELGSFEWDFTTKILKLLIKQEVDKG